MSDKEWSPDDPILISPHAPHEVAGVLRMQQSGWPAPKIAKELGMRGSRLINEITKALYEARYAAKANRPVYDQTIREGTE